jgi:hypothetical protein
MKITKQKIEQIVKEEIEKASQNPMASDVKRAGARIEKAPSLNSLLQKINTPKELEQLLLIVIKKVQVDPRLMKTAFNKVLKTVTAAQ